MAKHLQLLLMLLLATPIVTALPLIDRDAPEIKGVMLNGYSGTSIEVSARITDNLAGVLEATAVIQEYSCETPANSCYLSWWEPVTTCADEDNESTCQTRDELLTSTCLTSIGDESGVDTCIEQNKQTCKQYKREGFENYTECRDYLDAQCHSIYCAYVDPEATLACTKLCTAELDCENKTYGLVVDHIPLRLSGGGSFNGLWTGSSLKTYDAEKRYEARVEARDGAGNSNTESASSTTYLRPGYYVMAALTDGVIEGKVVATDGSILPNNTIMINGNRTPIVLNEFHAATNASQVEGVYRPFPECEQEFWNTESIFAPVSVPQETPRAPRTDEFTEYVLLLGAILVFGLFLIFSWFIIRR